MIFADSTSLFSRHTFLDVATHEHGHYLFGANHKTYGKMEGRGLGRGWEFSLSPWEVVKLGYIQQKFVNYSNPIHYLYDYSSHGGTAGTEGEVLQIPITSGEFFLLANRRKESDWDRRMGGDTLAKNRWQYLKNVNLEYGKGLYIYHNKDGYSFPEPPPPFLENIDMECADGLWNWEYAGVDRISLNESSIESIPVIKKTYPYYGNDIANDELNAGLDLFGQFRFAKFSPGSPDQFNPLIRGTASLYTNTQDYWFSLANLGDRWDAWNVGYNEIFSPYSSPNTNDMSNTKTGIFVWYKELETSTRKATLKIYRAIEDGGTRALNDILAETPPSRPMGLRVLSCDSQSVINSYTRIKIRWFHNMEPDMVQSIGGQDIKRYKIYRVKTDDISIVPPDAMAYAENYYQYLATCDILVNSIPEFIDEELVSFCYESSIGCQPPANCLPYPVRYRVQAVDVYESASVLSDFAKTEGVYPITAPPQEDGPNSSNNSEINPSEDILIPKTFSLKQNYPNPFNPSTNIQYDLPFNNFVSIKIYDVLGKEIVTLVDEFKNAGRYVISFNGTNLPSGMYYYKIKAGEFEAIRKMILIK